MITNYFKVISMQLALYNFCCSALKHHKYLLNNTRHQKTAFIFMRVKTKDGQIIDLVEKFNNTITLNSGSTLAKDVFTNGDMIHIYRIEPGTEIDDFPSSLKPLQNYFFITKIGSIIAMALSSNGVVYMITYLNNVIVFKKIDHTNVS